MKNIFLAANLFSIFNAGIDTAQGLTPCATGTVLDVAKMCRRPELIDLTCKLRSIKNEDEQKRFKARNLPFFTPAVVVTRRCTDGIESYSGLLCIDIDHLESSDDVQRVRGTLSTDKVFETELMFTSPRGHGVKWITSVDLSLADYKTWYETVRNYLSFSYQIEADKNPSSPVSACFLCADEEMVVNEGEVHPCDDTTIIETFSKEVTRSEANTDSPITNYSSDPSVSEQMRATADELVSRGIDITDNYSDWLNLGFALVDGMGEEGRELFHSLSQMSSKYKTSECDRQYDNCLKSNRGGTTYKTFFYMAKKAGIDPIEVLNRLRLATDFEGVMEEVSALSAQVHKCTLEEKIRKQGVSEDFNEKVHKCTSALSALTNGTSMTFSDKLCRENLPSFLHTVIDNCDSVTATDKMMLGTLAVISGLLTENLYSNYDRRKTFAPLFNIVYGGYATSKGELEACLQLVAPIKKEMRRKYEAEMSEYAVAKAEWDGMPKKNRGPEPKEPSFRTPIIHANSSASAVYRALEANDGWGIMFETEADTLTNMLSQKEYGDYTDLLRKIFHNETISMARVSEHINIEIEKPRMAVMLTCTPSQIPLLFSSTNVANGLASRFLFYGLNDEKVEFRNVFAKKDKSLEEIYAALGEELLPLYHALQARTEHPIQFVYSKRQEEEFVTTFNDVLQEQFSMLGDGIQGFIYRIALECFRYAMVLTALRRLSEWDKQESIFDDDEQALVCDERDFHTAMTIINCLINHTGRVYSVLATDDKDPFKQLPKELSESEKKLFLALPDSEEFTTNDVLRIAEVIGLKQRIAKRYLGDLTTRHQLLDRLSRGVYRKIQKQDSKEA